MKRSLTALVSVLAWLLTVAPAWATPYSGLVAFGDSLSDAGASPSAVLSVYKLLGGNCDPYHPCPPYFDGRLSNGPVAVEHLANSVLPGGATSANFRDFAVAGATTGRGNFADGGTAAQPGAYGLPGMAQQLGMYLSASGGTADPHALYFVWGGANDFLTLDSPVLAAQNIAGYVGALATAGAAHILVPNLPDLSRTPSVQSAGLQSQAHAFSTAFNSTLAIQLGNLGQLFPATDIIPFDTYAFLDDVVLNPPKYGLSNSHDACLPALPGAPCANPDSYVFWDSFHPTTAAAGVIAGAFAQAVPEPGTAALFAVGLLMLFHAGSRRRTSGGRSGRAAASVA